MKKIMIIVTLISGILCHVHAQQFSTVYGAPNNYSGDYNSFFGYGVASFGANNHNTAVGAFALLNGGPENTVVGSNALRGGHGCTAIGYYALHHNHREYQDFATTQAGYYNTGVGYKSLHENKFGDYNTAVGAEALFSNTASQNVAIGYQAMYSNVTGHNNTANGYRALYSNTANHNTAVGSYCMNGNVSGIYNTGIGHYTLAGNTTGVRNSAEGFRALDNNTTGSYNTAEGAHALNYVITGSYNSALGYDAGPTLADLTNTTAIGYLAVPTASNQIRIGNTSVTSIGGQEEWTAFSDGRFKKDIKEDVSGLDFIKELRPVSYTVDRVGLNKFLHVTDSSSNQAEVRNIPTRQTGFIAQEVEAIVKKTGYVFSGVDTPENENDPYGIRYSAFVVPLVKGMQELTARLEKQEQKITEQRVKIDSLMNQLGSKRENGKGIGTNDRAMLLQNNPNPFNAETEIKMTVPESVGFATVMIYNLEGKQLKNIQVNDRGEISIKILANELSAGMYLYALIADGKVVDTRRMILTH